MLFEQYIYAEIKYIAISTTIIKRLHTAVRHFDLEESSLQ